MAQARQRRLTRRDRKKVCSAARLTSRWLSTRICTGKRRASSVFQMRAREGKHLLKDLSSRIKAMRQAVGRVQKHAPAVQERYRQNLLERIRAAGLDSAELHDERLHKEVIF